VAALALFGLKVWSDRSSDSDFDGGGHSAAQRLARAGGARGDSSMGGYDSGDGSGSTRGGANRPGLPGGGDGPGGMRGSGPDGRGGSADSVRGGGARPGSGLGFSASGRSIPGSSGSGVAAGGGDTVGRIGPQVSQRQNLVDFLS